MSTPTFVVFPKADWRRALTNNSTSTSLGTIVPTTTQPATTDSSTPTSNTFVRACSGSEVQIMPFGGNDDNDAFHMELTLWRKVVVAGSTDLWVPYQIGQFLCTLSAAANGVAGAALIATDLLADTIADLGTTIDGNLCEVVSRANDKPALIRIMTGGFELWQATFKIDAGATADSANLIYTGA